MPVNPYFTFAPAPWTPFKDRAVLNEVVDADLYKKQGCIYENPEFEMKVVPDVHNYFALELLQRIRLSDINDEKLVLILPNPENAVYISLREGINRQKINCRNVHVFFLYEYANEKGEVAPWQSPFSRTGHFMRYFYNKLDAGLRMPIENIHFWTNDNIDTYSDEIAALGGADLCVTAMSISGGIGAIDAESFAAKDMEEFKAMGSRYVTPMPETIAYDSLRGMFGCSGDIGNVPPYAVTVGPKDLLASKEWIDVEYLAGCSGNPAHQKFPLRLALFGPICPENPASIMRLHKGICYVSADVAIYPPADANFDELPAQLEAIRKAEEE